MTLIQILNKLPRSCMVRILWKTYIYDYRTVEETMLDAELDLGAEVTYIVPCGIDNIIINCLE